MRPAGGNAQFRHSASSSARPPSSTSQAGGTGASGSNALDPNAWPGSSTPRTSAGTASSPPVPDKNSGQSRPEPRHRSRLSHLRCDLVAACPSPSHCSRGDTPRHRLAIMESAVRLGVRSQMQMPRGLAVVAQRPAPTHFVQVVQTCDVSFSHRTFVRRALLGTSEGPAHRVGLGEEGPTWPRCPQARRQAPADEPLRRRTSQAPFDLGNGPDQIAPGADLQRHPTRSLVSFVSVLPDRTWRSCAAKLLNSRSTADPNCGESRLGVHTS